MTDRLIPQTQGEDTVVTPPGQTPPTFDLETFLREREKVVEVRAPAKPDKVAE